MSKPVGETVLYKLIDLQLRAINGGNFGLDDYLRLCAKNRVVCREVADQLTKATGTSISYATANLWVKAARADFLGGGKRTREGEAAPSTPQSLQESPSTNDY